jgi:NTE family protein
MGVETTSETDSPDLPGKEVKAAKSRWSEFGPALCLSGGGFRATLFHLGSLRRLNELGALARLATVTSVSGGSITNGVLATRWAKLHLGPEGVFSNFDEVVAAPLRAFCARDIRTPLLLWVRLDPANWGRLTRDCFAVSGNYLAEKYEPLFRMKLADLPRPGPGAPRFVFCATNVRTGACWHFHGGPAAAMGDHYAGYCEAREVKVSEAVAASSAFPLTFSALRLRLPEGCELGRVDQWGKHREVSEKRGDQPHGDDRLLLLTDGGVYDNLGVEPVWKQYETVLVSDAGRLSDSVQKTAQWPLHRLKRAADIGIEQVGAIRRRWLFEQLESKLRLGAMWTIHTRPENFPGPDKQCYPPAVRLLLNRVRTDLNAFTPGEMGCLENHGYWLTDAAIRSYAPQLCTNVSATFRWPNRDWADEAKALSALRKSNSLNILKDLWGQITGRTA